MESKNIIAFAGAGGKTSAIYACAEKYLQKQKKVLIMTTTKMGTPRQKELFTASADETAVKDVLNRYGICVTGRLVQPEKISAWPDAVMRRLAKLADVVLIEADGAKMRQSCCTFGAFKNGIAVQRRSASVSADVFTGRTDYAGDL